MRTNQTTNITLSHSPKNKKESVDGALLLNKPEGVSSFKSMGLIKRKLGTKKVGHTGTLDPFASGLLILLSGKMTKMASFFSDMDKCYSAQFTFGKETDSLDTEGSIIAEAPVPTFKIISEKRELFLGVIRQRPPLFSAVHINGKRAYELARQNKTAEIPERSIRINSITIKEYTEPNLLVDIDCSKGTYIRSLARDWGLKANSRCYVSQLQRTSVGLFSLNEAVTAEDFEPEHHLISPYSLIKRLPVVDTLTIEDPQIIANIKTGKTIVLKEIKIKTEKDYIALFSPDKNMLALLEKKEEYWSYKFVV